MVGSAARMRVSSATASSASGTLKSTRTKTFLPEGSTSRIVLFAKAVNYRAPAAAGTRIFDTTNAVMSARRHA
jgi:hypothetical protein